MGALVMGVRAPRSGRARCWLDERAHQCARECRKEKVAGVLSRWTPRYRSTRLSVRPRTPTSKLKYPRVQRSINTPEGTSPNGTQMGGRVPRLAGTPTMARGIAETLDEARLRTLLAELGREAARFRFEVAPNPCVGAAVLAGGVVMARGFLEVWGEAHAEVRAFDAAENIGNPRESWDALVVTLEPCSSQGKTPPCIDRILASGVRCVVVGALDPDPRHGGAGLTILREKGVEVV